MISGRCVSACGRVKSKIFLLLFFVRRRERRREEERKKKRKINKR